MKEVYLPVGITAIHEDAFEYCTDLVIHCYEGTYAQTYAAEKNITVQLIEVKKTDIQGASVTVASSAVCTGNALTPAVTVSYNGQTLTSGVDYSVAYTDNINPGTATVTITGMGDYEGTTTKTFKITLAAPKLVSAASASYRSIKVTWEAVPGAASYNIYYKGGTAKSWKKIKTGVTGTSYVHTSSTAYPLATGTKYTYTVRAVYGKTMSGYEKAGKSAKPTLGTVKLGKATSAAYNKIKITWTKVAGASGYYIYRKSGSTWQRIGKTTGTSYIHTNSSKYPVKTGVTYTYTVKAVRKVGTTYVAGGYNKTGIKGKSVPAKPVLISAECTAEGKITIHWKKAAGATNYLVYRKNTNGKWQLIKNVKGASMIGYTHVSSSKYPIVAGKTYTYTVRSYTTTGKTYGLYDTAGKSVKAQTAAAVADTQLRKKAQEVIAQVTTSDMTQYQKLCACFNYIMTIKYRGWLFPDTTKANWRTKCAMDALTTMTGNCYGYAHGFAALARELGYEPYVVVIPKYHCFVIINGRYWDNLGRRMGTATPSKPYTPDQVTKF